MHFLKMSQNTLESWDLFEHIAGKKNYQNPTKLTMEKKLFYMKLFSTDNYNNAMRQNLRIYVRPIRWETMKFSYMHSKGNVKCSTEGIKKECAKIRSSLQLETVKHVIATAVVRFQELALF